MKYLKFIFNRVTFSLLLAGVAYHFGAEMIKDVEIKMHQSYCESVEENIATEGRYGHPDYKGIYDSKCGESSSE